MSKANLKLLKTVQEIKEAIEATEIIKAKETSEIDLKTIIIFLNKSDLLSEKQKEWMSKCAKNIHDGKETEAVIRTVEGLLDSVLSKIKAKQDKIKLIKKFKMEVLGESNE